MKLLIFPQKTLAARYVVPSASRSATRRSEIKIHATRLFSAFSPTGPGGRPAGQHHGACVYPVRLPPGKKG